MRWPRSANEQSPLASRVFLQVSSSLLEEYCFDFGAEGYSPFVACTRLRAGMCYAIGEVGEGLIGGPLLGLPLTVRWSFVGRFGVKTGYS